MLQPMSPDLMVMREFYMSDCNGYIPGFAQHVEQFSYLAIHVGHKSVVCSPQPAQSVGIAEIVASGTVIGVEVPIQQ